MLGMLLRSKYGFPFVPFVLLKKFEDHYKFYQPYVMLMLIGVLYLANYC